MIQVKTMKNLVDSYVKSTRDDIEVYAGMSTMIMNEVEESVGKHFKWAIESRSISISRREPPVNFGRKEDNCLIYCVNEQTDSRTHVQISDSIVKVVHNICIKLQDEDVYEFVNIDVETFASKREDKFYWSKVTASYGSGDSGPSFSNVVQVRHSLDGLDDGDALQIKGMVSFALKAAEKIAQDKG